MHVKISIKFNVQRFVVFRGALVDFFLSSTLVLLHK